MIPTLIKFKERWVLLAFMPPYMLLASIA